MSQLSTSPRSPRPQLHDFWHRPWVLMACALASLLASALGGVGGAVVGTAIVLSCKALESVPEANLGQRATMLAMLALAGLVG
ncbi:MAG: hypothetical protein WCH37_07060 [Synechococcaceae cyanobacterium ELA182]